MAAGSYSIYFSAQYSVKILSQSHKVPMVRCMRFSLETYENINTLGNSVVIGANIFRSAGVT